MSARRVFTHPRTWLIPLVLILGLGALFPAIYLVGTSDPQGNLEGLPVALVVEDTTADAPLAASVADAIEDGADEKLALDRMDSDEMAQAMDDDAIAGAIVIPAGFDEDIASLLPGSATVSVPTVHIYQNAGDGGLSNGLLIGNAIPLLTGVSQGFGAQMAAQIGTPLPPANSALLAQPFDVVASLYEPLPDHAGLGTSAFYYALILILIAFIGASIVGPIIDAALGFAPSEVGPMVERRAYVRTSRVATFLGKVVILVVASPLAALVTQLIATEVIGIPTADPTLLWLFSSAAIAAVGSSALAVFAIFGPGMGSLANTLFFIALAMTSSGGTVPVEATPPFFQWLSNFTPFRPVVDGIRSFFYFDGNPAAGLADAWVMIGIGGAVGIALGIVVTLLYGRVRLFSRDPAVEQDPSAPSGGDGAEQSHLDGAAEAPRREAVPTP